MRNGVQQASTIHKNMSMIKIKFLYSLLSLLTDLFLRLTNLKNAIWPWLDAMLSWDQPSSQSDCPTGKILDPDQL